MRRASLSVIERDGRALPQPERVSVLEPDDLERGFRITGTGTGVVVAGPRDAQFSVRRDGETLELVDLRFHVLTHNGVAFAAPSGPVIALRDGDLIGAATLVLRLDIEGAGALDDAVALTHDLLGWRVAGETGLLRAALVNGDDERMLEAVQLGPTFRDDVRRYEALGALAPKRFGLAVHSGQASAILLRRSTRGARVSAILARTDGVADDATMLLFAQALVDAQAQTGEVVQLKHLALTFEGEVVVAALRATASSATGSLVRELGRLFALTQGDAQLRLKVAASLMMSDEGGAAGSASAMLAEGIAALGRPDAPSLAALVTRLFPDAWAAEERWREEVALLDRRERRRLLLASG